MKRKIITTADGSKTIKIIDWNEQYHSMHGAIQEANHVFITHGLKYYKASILGLKPRKTPIKILEIGFGTGLNAFLTALYAEDIQQPILYDGVEAYPVALNEIEQLNYSDLISKTHDEVFFKLHDLSWNKYHEINSYFSIKKKHAFFQDILALNTYNIIYFDAFGARVQPELWTETIFKNMLNALQSNGVLVTYSAKGSVRRAMESVGFKVSKLPGPPGKREMLRAEKH